MSEMYRSLFAVGLYLSCGIYSEMSTFRSLRTLSEA